MTGQLIQFDARNSLEIFLNFENKKSNMFDDIHTFVCRTPETIFNKLEKFDISYIHKEI